MIHTTKKNVKKESGCYYKVAVTGVKSAMKDNQMPCFIGQFQLSNIMAFLLKL